MADRPYNSADFHNAAHKQIVNAVHDTLADAKLDWDVVAPFLEAARALCRDDFREGARLRLHPADEDGEAYLAIAVADREDGAEWLSESYWLADIALADADPEAVRSIAAALERSLERVNAWLDTQEEGGPGEPGPLPQGS